MAAVCFCLAAVAAEAADMQIKATDSGKVTVQGDVINAGGDVTISKLGGLSKEDFQQMLREELARANQEMQARGLAAEERRLLELKAKAAEEKLADLQKSYEEELARRRNAEKALDDFKGQLPDARLEAAGKSLREGDAAAAEQVFDDVADKAASLPKAALITPRPCASTGRR